MMGIKCKRHPYEQGVGVCASCLRERLLDLIAARSGRPQHHCCGADPYQLQRHQSSSSGHQQQRQLPPPLIFPRSVSPYVSRRRSVGHDFPGDGDADAGCHRRRTLRFFSTPQVGAGAAGRKAAAGGFFSSLFGGGAHHRSGEVEPEHVSSGSSHHSSSWFSALLPGRRRRRRKEQQRNISRFFEEAAAEEEVYGARRHGWQRDHHFGGGDDSASESGYSTESPGRVRIAGPTPARKQPSAAHRTMSGFVVCLSPLVRASPRRSQAGESGVPVGLRSGEQRGPRAASLPRLHRRQASGGGGPPALGPNRSRKLADIGRFR